jgi:hypothetical protein
VVDERLDRVGEVVEGVEPFVGVRCFTVPEARVVRATRWNRSASVLIRWRYMNDDAGNPCRSRRVGLAGLPASR